MLLSAEKASHKVIEIDGWTVHVHTQLFLDEPEKSAQAIDLLQDQLRFVRESVSVDLLPKLQRVPLWVSPQYPGVGPKAEYHPARQWLVDNGRDPAMARCVEFTNVFIFDREVKRMPCFVLHELAHAYHDQVLSFGNKKVSAVYEAAKKSGSYDMVKRNDGQTVKSYAMTNPMEYFAENTEAYFGQNDFYPFNAKELESHDPEMFKLLREIWGPVRQPGKTRQPAENQP